MIQVVFTPPNTPEWATWLQDCQTAQDELNADVAAGKEVEIKGALYGRLKQDVFIATSGPFFGKCAFCETFIYATQHGDIEHYRPKGGVKDASNKPILLADGTPHPGYYWLAYNFTNLLPSCQLCNQPSTARSQGVRIGKWNHFPLADEAHRAQRPGGESAESPLLINPTVDNPAVHLGFNVATGVLFAVNGSPRGQACIDIFGLNSRDLPSKRLDKYRAIHALFLHCFSKRLLGADASIEHASLQRVGEGRDEYAVAGQAALEEGRQLIDRIRSTM